MRSRSSITCAAFMAVTLRWQDPPQTVFRANADAVAVDVSVRRGNRPLTGLAPVDFQILDNGVQQEVADLSYGKVPIDVTVALDVSYSVTGRLLEELRKALVLLMRDLQRDDRLKLVMFNAQVTRVVDFTSDVRAVERAVQSATAGGGTTIFDAISVSLISASDPNRRQIVVVFTDGSDSSSTTEYDVLLDVARRTHATVTLMTPDPTDATTLRPGSALLERHIALGRLAAETGGWMMSTSNTDLTAAFRNVLDEFRSTYLLHFIPRDVERRGFHTLSISVKRPSVTVRARRGYFGG